MKFRHVNPQKAKIVMIGCFASGGFGLYMGLVHGVFYVTMLSTINICIGGLFGCVMLLQKPKVRDRRKKNSRDP